MKKATLMLPLAIFAAAVLFVAAQPCFSAEGTLSETNAATSDSYETVTDESYRIKPEDVMRLDVYGEESLKNVQMLVTPDGLISIPFIGEIKAEGMTPAELRDEIAKKLESEGILINPVVQVAILQIHRPRVRVLGDVYRPGEVEFKDGDRLLDAIASAGSYRETAWLEKTTLTRRGVERPIEIDLRKLLGGDHTQNLELKQGDTIHIPAENYENKIYVLGEVMRPGIYSLKDKTTVLAAISLANGPTPRGALRGTLVVRGDPARPTRVQVNLSRLFDKGDITQDIQLQSGDIVLVPESNKPDWNKVSSVLSTIMNLTYLRRYGLF